MSSSPWTPLYMQAGGQSLTQLHTQQLIYIHNLKRNISKNVDFNHWGCFEAPRVPILRSLRPLWNCLEFNFAPRKKLVCIYELFLKEIIKKCVFKALGLFFAAPRASFLGSPGPPLYLKVMGQSIIQLDTQKSFDVRNHKGNIKKVLISAFGAV